MDDVMERWRVVMEHLTLGTEYWSTGRTRRTGESQGCDDQSAC